MSSDSRNPRAANRLLASIHGFCESERMSAALDFIVLPIAYGGIRFHAITAAQVKFQVPANSLNSCK